MQIDILKVLEKDSRLTPAEIGVMLAIPEEDVKAELERLREENILWVSYLDKLGKNGTGVCDSSN